MAEEKGIVKYTARDGQEITLGFDVVRTYLVSGKKELVTPQELIFFMGICKSRGLNPFKKDAYLIKYNEDPAAIVTSIDFYRSRARAQKDCKGWKAGIIVEQKPIGDKGRSYLEYRDGALLLENEKLVGGWFEARPEGWTESRSHTVSLRGYIKKRRDGSITRFWEEENQPSQIMKVAEAQGLRMLWPDQFQQLYSEEEIQAPAQNVDMGMEMAAKEKGRQEGIEKFKESIPYVDQVTLDDFLSKLSQANRCTIEDVQVEAAKNLDKFWEGYAEFEKSQKKNDKKLTEISLQSEDQNIPLTAVYMTHADADVEITKQDQEVEKKKRGRPATKKEMNVCPDSGKFPGKQVAQVYCEKQCDRECDAK